MSEFDDIRLKLHAFVAARDWEQFHSPKSLSMALIAEAAELVEHFQWLSEAQSAALAEDERARVAMELADVLLFLLLLADKLGVDLGDAARRKMELNELRYPAATVRGSAKKFTPR